MPYYILPHTEGKVMWFPNERPDLTPEPKPAPKPAVLPEPVAQKPDELPKPKRAPKAKSESTQKPAWRSRKDEDETS